MTTNDPDIRAAAIAARESITAEQRAAWTVAGDFADDNILYSGFWLHERLIAAGCEPELAEKIGFAAGQRQAHEFTREGIWAQVIIALRNYTEHGIWEEPGAELATKLLHENFGTPVDVNKLLTWLVSLPTSRRELAKMLVEIQQTGKLPACPKTPWEK